MLFADGWGKDRFGEGRSVPDYTQAETKLWVFSAIKNYARASARRGFVLFNAHVFEKGWSYKGTLLMDFHAYPSRPRDVVGQPLEATLRVDRNGDCGDAAHCHDGSCEPVPYRMSAGGITWAGYRVDSLP